MAAATGATTKELMHRAGHSTPAAALRYQHATADRDQAIASALEDIEQGAIVPISAHPSRTDRARKRGTRNRKAR
jgi:hypothetical protein